ACGRDRNRIGAQARTGRCVRGRCRRGHSPAPCGQSHGGRAWTRGIVWLVDNGRSAMDSNGLTQFAGAVASGAVRVVDLTFTLSPDFPVIVLPPEFGQAAPVRIQQISRYDAAGPAWYWNNLTFGEHTGTHFDAPIHWF